MNVYFIGVHQGFYKDASIGESIKFAERLHQEAKRKFTAKSAIDKIIDGTLTDGTILDTNSTRVENLEPKEKKDE